jgi:hypothetical protein
VSLRILVKISLVKSVVKLLEKTCCALLLVRAVELILGELMNPEVNGTNFLWHFPLEVFLVWLYLKCYRVYFGTLVLPRTFFPQAELLLKEFRSHELEFYTN